MSETTLRERLGWLNKLWVPVDLYDVGLLVLGLVTFLLLGGSTLGLCIFVFAACASGLFPAKAAPWVLVSMAVLACSVIVYNGFGMPGPLTENLDHHHFYGRAHSNMTVFFAMTVGLSFYAGSLVRNARARRTTSSVLSVIAILSVVAGAFALYLPYATRILEMERVNLERLLERYSNDMSELRSLVPDSGGSERKAVTDRFNADYFGRRYEGLVDDAR